LGGQQGEKKPLKEAIGGKKGGDQNSKSTKLLRAHFLQEKNPSRQVLRVKKKKKDGEGQDGQMKVLEKH